MTDQPNCCDGDAWRKMMVKHMAGNPNFYLLLDDLAQLHHTKNQDYCGAGQYQGMDNFVLAARFAGVSVRTVFRVLQGIKRARLVALESDDREPNHESIEDSRKDLANYELLEMAFERTFTWIDDPRAGQPNVTGPVIAKVPPKAGIQT